METQFKKTVIRMSFEATLEQLKKELYKEGFEPGGITDYHQLQTQDQRTDVKKYIILSVYDPFLYNDMMRISSFEGTILPCLISVIENYPGETAIVPYNPTEAISHDIQDAALQNLATEVTKRLDLAIKAIGHDHLVDPDLVTSWS